MLRTHFAVKPPFDMTEVAACGRGSRIRSNVFDVDCRNCQKQDSFILAMDEAKSAKHKAFMAQEPRPMSEPWHEGNVPMVCKNCQGNLFRVGERTCYGHYQNYVCSACGGTESRLTETGMSF